MTKEPEKTINIRIYYSTWARFKKMIASRKVRITLKDLLEEISKMKV